MNVIIITYSLYKYNLPIKRGCIQFNIEMEYMHYQNINSIKRN